MCDNSIYAREAFFIYINSGQHLTRELRTIRHADNANSEGGTYNIMSVVGTAGTSPAVVANTSLVTNGVMDGIGLATTPDGGITNDFRIYPASGTIVAGTNPAYLAGSNANTATLYTTLFPAITAPTVQQGLSTAEYGSDASNTQLGSTQAGSFGFAWHHVVITKNNNTVTWDVDGTRLVNADITGITLGGNNIALGISDVNSTTARHPSLAFLIVDNVVVTDIATTLTGDHNGDTHIDAADYVTWREPGRPRRRSWRLQRLAKRFGTAGSGSVLNSGVPEPASALLLVLSAVRLCCTARRRS